MFVRVRGVRLQAAMLQALLAAGGDPKSDILGLPLVAAMVTAARVHGVSEQDSQDCLRVLLGCPGLDLHALFEGDSLPQALRRRQGPGCSWAAAMVEVEVGWAVGQRLVESMWTAVLVCLFFAMTMAWCDVRYVYSHGR